MPTIIPQNNLVLLSQTNSLLSEILNTVKTTASSGTFGTLSVSGTATIGTLLTTIFSPENLSVTGTFSAPNALNVYNFLAFGADPSGATDCSGAFTAAFSAMSNVGILYLPIGTYKITSNVVIPEGITLRFENSAISIAATYTLTINGAVDAPDQAQIFIYTHSTTGSPAYPIIVTQPVTIPATSPNKYLTPYHFGAAGDGTTDDQLAMTACVNASPNVYFPPGTFLAGSGPVVCKLSKVHWWGTGPNSTVQNPQGATTWLEGNYPHDNGLGVLCFYGASVADIEIDHLTFQGNVTQVTGSTAPAGSAQNFILPNCEAGPILRFSVHHCKFQNGQGGPVWQAANTYRDGPAWQQSTNYVFNQVVKNGSGIFVCTVAGTSASTGTGPTGTNGQTGITDGGVTWTCEGNGTISQFYFCDNYIENWGYLTDADHSGSVENLITVQVTALEAICCRNNFYQVAGGLGISAPHIVCTDNVINEYLVTGIWIGDTLIGGHVVCANNVIETTMTENYASDDTGHLGQLTAIGTWALLDTLGDAAPQTSEGVVISNNTILFRDDGVHSSLYATGIETHDGAVTVSNNRITFSLSLSITGGAMIGVAHTQSVANVLVNQVGNTVRFICTAATPGMGYCNGFTAAPAQPAASPSILLTIHSIGNECSGLAPPSNTQIGNAFEYVDPIVPHCDILAYMIGDFADGGLIKCGQIYATSQLSGTFAAPEMTPIFMACDSRTAGGDTGPNNTGANKRTSPLALPALNTIPGTSGNSTLAISSSGIIGTGDLIGFTISGLVLGVPLSTSGPLGNATSSAFLVDSRVSMFASCQPYHGGIAGTVADWGALASAPVVPWYPSTVYQAYVMGSYVTNSGNIYQCTASINDHTSAPSGPGPTGTGSSITDNNVTWKYLSSDSSYTTGVIVQSSNHLDTDYVSVYVKPY